jgi:hypothetical protein
MADYYNNNGHHSHSHHHAHDGHSEEDLEHGGHIHDGSGCCDHHHDHHPSAEAAALTTVPLTENVSGDNYIQCLCMYSSTVLYRPQTR